MTTTQTNNKESVFLRLVSGWLMMALIATSGFLFCTYNAIIKIPATMPTIKNIICIVFFLAVGIWATIMFWREWNGKVD